MKQISNGRKCVGLALMIQCMFCNAGCSQMFLNMFKKQSAHGDGHQKGVLPQQEAEHFRCQESLRDVISTSETAFIGNPPSINSPRTPRRHCGSFRCSVAAVEVSWSNFGWKPKLFSAAQGSKELSLAAKTAEKLVEYFTLDFGLPDILISCAGACYDSEELRMPSCHHLMNDNCRTPRNSWKHASLDSAKKEVQCGLYPMHLEVVCRKKKVVWNCRTYW